MTNRVKPTTGSAGETGFIPSIEGLRALAVLVVLFYHLDIELLGGGFLGVDLFFVISGFIITRNILTDMSSGDFSLSGFYIRRFRRLYPALLATIFCTLVASILIVPPVQLVETAKSAIFSLFSIANFHFWWESGYFDSSAATKPLLHTWSLSVEEQFYLFWPTLLSFLVVRKYQFLAALLLLLASIASSIMLRDDMPNGIFYLLPFRAHQLMAGAIIAILAVRASGTLADVATVIGTTGFILLSLCIDGKNTVLSGAVLVTLLGSILLLGRESRLANLAYGGAVMQWIGKRSYAIYLVHWPLIVLFKYATDFHLGVAAQSLLLLSTFVAASVLHELVEKPFRQRGNDTTYWQKASLKITASALAVSVSISLLYVGNDGFPSRVDHRIQDVLKAVPHEVVLRGNAIRYGQCNLHDTHTIANYDMDECASTQAGKFNVLIIGDSSAADSYMMLSQTYEDIHFMQATAGGCTAVLDLEFSQERYPACEDLNRLRFRELAKLDVDLIILSSQWTTARVQPLQETLKYLESLGKQVLVLGPRYNFEESVPLLLSKQESIFGANEIIRDKAVQTPQLVEEIRSRIPELNMIDMGSIQCTPHCDVLEGDRLLYFDHFHFTVLGARRMGERFKRTIDFERTLKRTLN